MQIESHLSAELHMQIIKNQMSGHFELGQQRFTGFFLGQFFHITHHAGSQWNRRITNEKNTAIGYIQNSESGCTLRFINIKGLLAPTQLLILYCIVSLSVLSFKHQIEMNFLSCMGLGALITFIVSPIYSLIECFTQRSRQGKQVLLELLKDPASADAYIDDYDLS